MGTDQLIALQSPHRRIDRSARQPRHLHHAETIDIAGVDRLKDHRRRMGELCFGRHSENYTYVALYLTIPYYECYIG